MPSQQDVIYSKGYRDRRDGSISSNQDILAITKGESSITNLVVRAASLCNQIIVEKCGMCTVYCDEQLQYEALSQDIHNTAQNSIFDIYHQEVENARNFLFDEDSVVESINDRA